ncbi:MAG: NADH-quinone oxidoreductase subunit L, partial [Deltaproteobacteria bacterium]
MIAVLPFILILSPFLAAILCLVCRVPFCRMGIILLATLVLTAASLLLKGSGLVSLSAASISLLQALVHGADFLLLAIMAFFGWRFRRWIIVALSLVQILLLVYLESVSPAGNAASWPLFRIDGLSLVIVRLVSMVGALICLYAIPYMNVHEERLR